MIGAVTAYAKIKKEKIMNYRTLILLEDFCGNKGISKTGNKQLIPPERLSRQL